jgi:flavin-dependent dehydrogenase
MYVTPIGREEVCVAFIARKRPRSFESALHDFPQLRERLAGAVTTTTVKGAPTVTRTLRRVARGNVALIGEASGSSDAITGEGLAMGFRQANALADAIVAGDLSLYQRAHRKIATLPHTMARAMLLMDHNAWIRTQALRAFAAKPYLFQQLLSVHVGAVKPADLGIAGALNIGWNLLTA